MLKPTTLLLTAIFAISGCATCREHPVACTIGGAIIVGSVAAIVKSDRDKQQMHSRQIAPSAGPECRNGVCPP